MGEHAHEHGLNHPHTAPPSDVQLRVRALEPQHFTLPTKKPRSPLGNVEDHG